MWNFQALFAFIVWIRNKAAITGSEISSYLQLIQTSDSKKGSLVKGFTHSRRVPWVEIFKKVHTKLSSHQNEASRSNEVLQIPTSSDPKY